MASLARTTKTRPRNPALSTGWGIVAVFVVYVLMLYQLPLAPLLARVLHPGADHAPCTSAICHCKAGCTCGHHTASHGAMNHADEGHGEHSSLRTCGTPDAATPFVLPVIDKALLAESDATGPRLRPPLTFAGTSRSVLHQPIHDIFHPPRLA